MGLTNAGWCMVLAPIGPEPRHVVTKQFHEVSDATKPLEWSKVNSGCHGNAINISEFYLTARGSFEV